MALTSRVPLLVESLCSFLQELVQRTTWQVLEKRHRMEFTCNPIGILAATSQSYPSKWAVTVTNPAFLLIGGHPLDTPHRPQELPAGLPKNISTYSLNFA